jgi:DNA-binding transcriptional LysR family regulator
MTGRAEMTTIDLHLIRVLHTLITERSVSRAALRLHSTQPAVSAQLRRLRELTGDALLVRSGHGMQPTAAALQLLEPASQVLQGADRLFSRRLRSAPFDAAAAGESTFRVAASDYLDPLFLPALVTHIKRWRRACSSN